MGGLADKSNSDNTSVGFSALKLNRTGIDNVAIGAYAGINTLTGNNNVLIGKSAGNNHNSSNLTAIGTSALASINNATADGSVAIGYNSLTALTSGGGNTSVGLGSMDALTTGSNNTGLGDRSLSGTDDGANNTAVGAFAMETGNCGDNNTAVGANSLKACTGTANVAIGQNAGLLIAGGEANICIGNGAGDAITTGNYNTVIGANSDISAAGGTDQVVIGEGVTGVANNAVTLGNASITAVYMAQDSGATVHCSAIDITNADIDTNGALFGANDNSGTKFVRIHGSTHGQVDIGGDGTSLDTRMNFFNGNGAVGTIKTDGSATQFNTSSDYRLKENEVTMPDALTRLGKLKPYRFNFKADKDKTVDGFFAHEVAEIVPEAISGDKDAVDEKGEIDPQGIDQSKLVPLLVKAVQELSARVEELENK
jgi:hypothetical protein